MGLFGKPHRHMDGEQSCWCAEVEMKAELKKEIEMINSQPAIYCPNYKHKRKVEMAKMSLGKYLCDLCGAVVILFNE